MNQFISRQKQILLCVILGALLSSWTMISKAGDHGEPKVIKWNELEAIINKKSEKLQIINFWATWCAPCIKELPYFEALNRTASDKVEVTLVSLNFADELEKRVLPFIKRRKLHSQVLLLDEVDYNSWIDKVDPSWSGAIPATLIINPLNGKRKFVEKELNEGELNSLIEEVLN